MRVALVALVAVGACVRGPAPPAQKPHPTLTYLGVAGWQINDGDQVLLVDPYFSRLDPEDSDVLRPDEAAIVAHTPAHALAILVEHTHYDHVLDVPVIAKRTGARVVGTRSTLNVMRAAGLAEPLLTLARDGDTLQIGPFTVQVVAGLHSLTGQASSEVPANVTWPMTAAQYGEGGTFDYLVTVEGRRVLFIGSANFVEDKVRGLHPDVAAIGVGLRDKVPDYTCRLMRALDAPPLVFTNHFDAHKKPLGHETDIGDAARADLAHFADEVHTCAPKTEVRVPVHFRPIDL